tara:strand:+ start:56946 stop:58091 length:1146 start_codon:yes stop_codon:yes gene_type:complete
VLARSVRQHEPDAVFIVVLCDTPPDNFDIAAEDFDHIILLETLPIDERPAWTFQHNVVELCTAVKGLGFQEIFKRFNAEKVVFLDPDIVLFSSLELVREKLDAYSVLLTPHQTEPEEEHSAILDNEVSSLKYGVFNLGFLAVRRSAQGCRFIDWWSDRLRDFCFDERGRGLFTDQKWADLAPALFYDLGILREPQLNVSTWNISRRELTGDLDNGIYVNGQPLCFYHFSGVDSGALKVMMDVYGKQNPALASLRAWYVQQCNAMGQRELGTRECIYGLYSNGDRIRPAERLLYRYREDLRDRFPDPYDCTAGGGYQAWYAGNMHTEHSQPDEELLSVMRHELDAIHHSISWRVFRKLATAYRRMGMRLGINGLLQRLSHRS